MFRVGISIAGLALYAAVISTNPVAAATIYVDASNSSGVEDGTLANPYNTIQEGYDAALADDVVSVAPGIYVGPLVWKSGVRLRSELGPDVTIVDGGQAGRVFTPPPPPVPPP